MTNPEELSTQEAQPSAPSQQDVILRRMRDVRDLEIFLGIQSGGHRDPWNKGGVGPRWPEVPAPPAHITGKPVEEIIIDFDAQEMTSEPILPTEPDAEQKMD